METASGTRFPDHGARLCRYSSVSTTHGDGSAEVTSMWLVFCRPSDVGNEGRTMTGPVQTRPGFPGGSAGPAAKRGRLGASPGTVPPSGDPVGHGTYSGPFLSWL